MSLDDRTLTAAQLRLRARGASQRAEDARRLAAEIEVRRQEIIGRVDQSLVHHTTEVWQSRAAAGSRLELLTVGFALRQVGRALLDTEAALESTAADFDDDAGVRHRRAVTLDAQAAEARRVSKSTAVG